MKKLEKNLYVREYRTTGGNFSKLYYCIMTSWDGKRRTIPVGDSLSAARDRVGELRNLDRGRYDFDAEKKQREHAKVKALTVREWLDRYLELMKGARSFKTMQSQCVQLKRLLGDLPLSEVSRVKIIEYKQRRLLEPIMRHGKPVEGTEIKGSSVNREVSCLNAALNFASGEGLCNGAPTTKKERETPRDRTLSIEEFQSLLDQSKRWLQRVLIGANETGMDRGMILKLTWDSVRDGLIVLTRQKTGAKQRIGISPALQDVLDELREQYRRIPNMEKRVFTTAKGRPISKSGLRNAFDRVVSKAKVQNFQFRDFRHCARTKWAVNGLPFEVAEGGLGHKLAGVAGRYTNLTDGHVKEAFRKMWTTCEHENESAAVGERKSS
jgi:integrase